MALIFKSTLFSGLILTFLLTLTSINIDITGEDQNSNTIEMMVLHDHENNLHLFDMSTNEVSAGWTTFRCTNASDSDHFAVIYKVPEVDGLEKPGSLVKRALENAQLLGGVMEMTAGSRAYYNVNLDPGDYAWIAEVPNPEEKNMVYRFSISD